jgi:hypothetical protein
MKQPKKGSVSETTLDDFLAERGLLEACEAQAIKEIIAEGLADITAGRVKEFDPAAIIARGKKRLSDK